MYIDLKKDGTLNHFVCDFLQDEHGRFHFIKINDFGTDGKPVQTGNWMISEKLKEQDRLRQAARAGVNKCEAKILCEANSFNWFSRQKSIWWGEKSA